MPRRESGSSLAESRSCGQFHDVEAKSNTSTSSSSILSNVNLRHQRRYGSQLETSHRHEVQRPIDSSTSSSTGKISSSFSSNGSSINSRNTSICKRSLVSLLACSMSLFLVSSCLGIADAGALMSSHPFSKRSFMDIQCKGVYDKSLFARLDRICEDCYNLFREPQLHTLCRKNCFTSDYFKGCLDVLLLQDEMEWIQTSIKQLHGADPGV